MKSFPSRCCQVFVTCATSMQSLRDNFIEEFKQRDTDALRSMQLLVPLKYFDIDKDLFDTLNEDTQRYLVDGGTMWTCKYFDSSTGSCGIYESRPSMCREFPGNDVENVDENGVNLLCKCCTSTYCAHHPKE